MGILCTNHVWWRAPRTRFRSIRSNKNLACRHISIVAYWTNGTRQNPTNYFAEVEQVAFGTGVLVDGLEFSDDKLLQGRTFSYSDTQRYRVGQITSSYLLISQNRRCYESAWWSDGLPRWWSRSRREPSRELRAKQPWRTAKSGKDHTLCSRSSRAPKNKPNQRL